MRHPALDRLLILQDRDTRRLGLEAQLKAIPRDIAAVEQKIASEKAAIETARTEVRTLETRKKLLETEIGTNEAKLAKYKTQQASVRKNDEYQALGHEIETTEAAIGALEEQEIGVMLEIDEAKKRFSDAEASLKQNISGHEERIRNLRERETNLAAEQKLAQAEFETARQPLEEPVLRLYDRTAARHQPAVVAVRGAKCGGCHLKISGEVETDARRGEKLAVCDQCGRIVWWES
jgi:predicted  nucleic acid-binding Zn-ribbon protein